MIESEILEGNLIIAEFMELTPNPIDNGKTWTNSPIYINDEIYSESSWTILQYNLSWDWLMPVIEKIEGLGYEVEIKNHLVSIWIDEDEYISSSNEKKIDSAYTAVVEFIKWLNETKNKEVNNDSNLI